MTATVAPLETSDPGESLQLLPISVNLLPEEVIRARSARAARRLTIGVLVLAVLGTGGWYYSVSRDTDAADQALNSAKAEASRISQSDHGFGTLRTVKGNIRDIQTQLKSATTGSIAWNVLYPAIRRAAPGNVVVTGITGTSANTGGSSGTAGTAPAAPIPGQPTGTVIITGTSSSKPAISSFVNKLGTVSGLGSVNVTNVSADQSAGTSTFSISAATTNAALSTRYTKGVK